MFRRKGSVIEKAQPEGVVCEAYLLLSYLMYYFCLKREQYILILMFLLCDIYSLCKLNKAQKRREAPIRG
jgi:hypothetical protein